MEMIIKRLLYHYPLLSLFIVTQRTSTPTTTSSYDSFSNPKKLYICHLSRSSHTVPTTFPLILSLSSLLPVSLSCSLYLFWASSFDDDDKHFKLAAIHGFQGLFTHYVRSYRIE